MSKKSNNPKGRPRHKRTDDLAEKVKAAKSFGHANKVIAKSLRISENTLRREYAPELKLGTFDMVLAVEAAHFKSATGGNVVAQIHILECKGGWSNPNRARNVSIDLPPTAATDKLNEEMTIEVSLKLDTHLREDE